MSSLYSQSAVVSCFFVLFLTSEMIGDLLGLNEMNTWFTKHQCLWKTKNSICRLEIKRFCQHYIICMDCNIAMYLQQHSYVVTTAGKWRQFGFFRSVNLWTKLEITNSQEKKKKSIVFSKEKKNITSSEQHCSYNIM